MKNYGNDNPLSMLKAVVVALGTALLVMCLFIKLLPYIVEILNEITQ